MRTCPYCGKAYSDAVIVCPIDQRALIDTSVQWENKVDQTARPRPWIKIGAATLAFAPMFLLILATVLSHTGKVPESVSRPVIFCGVIFNFPAFSIVLMLKDLNMSRYDLILSALVLMFMWSSFLAWVFWKIAAMFLGEDEPEATRGQYDWAAFRVRFVIGFVVGFLSGWRFVKNTSSIKTVFIASIVTGVGGGFLYGITRPPDFWSRT